MNMHVRPLTLLIAALGGEGGGVLANWIVSAAENCDLPVQSTSIPGVAQRTGATTYYIEIFPTPHRDLQGRKPMLALAPGIGDIDILLASELLEAARMVAAGYATPDHTLTIASTSRFYVIDEKAAMGDGRYDQARLGKVIRDHSQQSLLVDMEGLAQRSDSMINAVMLGLLAGCGLLPLGPNNYESAIRRDGKAVDSNLRGFRTGLDAAQAAGPHGSATNDGTLDVHSVVSTAAEKRILRLPQSTRQVARSAVQRLVAYQDQSYADLYLDRLDTIAAADALSGAEGKVIAATAVQLALRMSYEDVIRVAQAKIAPGRRARIAAGLKAKTGEPLRLVEFLKPGIEEACSLLPPWLGHRLLRFSERRGWTGRLHWAMEVNSASVSGYLRFRLLAALRKVRRFTLRYAEEQRAIGTWLAAIEKATILAPSLAYEIVECACLIKGYGDTHKRGASNYQLIESRVIAPALAGAMPVHLAADAVASARSAALADPDGERLAICLDEIGQRATHFIAAESP
jgi:indolepyruvate ferredoxin oxidoreductase beta subunit